MKDVIVYYPWGSGGDFLRNLITVNPEFDFIDDKEFTDEITPSFESRHSFFLSYYKPVTGDEWASRDWKIRRKLLGRYYQDNGIKFWNPWARTAFECLGSPEELERILESKPLHCFDRTKIEQGEIQDQVSPYTLKECNHVFLLPSKIQLVTDIYYSKNPSLAEFDLSVPEAVKKDRIFLINKFRTHRLQEFANSLGSNVYKYSADQLYTNDGAVLLQSILKDLKIEMLDWIVSSLHCAWLDNTRQIYSAYHNKELP